MEKQSSTPNPPRRARAHHPSRSSSIFKSALHCCIGTAPSVCFTRDVRSRKARNGSLEVTFASGVEQPVVSDSSNNPHPLALTMNAAIEGSAPLAVVGVHHQSPAPAPHTTIWLGYRRLGSPSTSHSLGRFLLFNASAYAAFPGTLAASLNTLAFSWHLVSIALPRSPECLPLSSRK